MNAIRISEAERNAIKAEIIAEMMEKKKSESIWMKSKKRLYGKAKAKFPNIRSHLMVDSVATIARLIIRVQERNSVHRSRHRPHRCYT